MQVKLDHDENSQVKEKSVEEKMSNEGIPNDSSMLFSGFLQKKSRGRKSESGYKEKKIAFSPADQHNRELIGAIIEKNGKKMEELR